MKSLQMKLMGLLTIAAAVLVGSVAVAQTYTPQNNGNGIVVQRGLMTSGTTVKGVEVDPAKNKPIWVFLKGSALASATITNELADGTVLNSQTVAVSTAVSNVSFTAPAYFERVRVSTTTTLTGTNNVSVTIIQ